MFDINGWEFAVLGLLALILVGPKRLPVVARQAARWLAAARSMWRDATARVREEVGQDPLVQELSALPLRNPHGRVGFVGRALMGDEVAERGHGDGTKHWDSEAT